MVFHTQPVKHVGNIIIKKIKVFKDGKNPDIGYETENEVKASFFPDDFSICIPAI